MISLDTNYLLRFLTNDIKLQAQIAKKVIEGSKGVYIPIVTIAETVYFLRNHYEKGKDDVCKELGLLVKQPNIITEKYVPLALRLYKNENISFYDSLFIAEAIYSKSEIKTFDKKLNNVFTKYLQS